MEKSNIGSLVRIDNEYGIVIDEISGSCIVLLPNGLKEIWQTNYIQDIVKTFEDLINENKRYY
jgi:hypothetical protein